jgi:hydrogenase maturation protease
MKKVLVLGLGNDLLTDDAVGLRVVHDVRQRLAGDARIEVKETAETGLALLDVIVDYASLIVVDSVKTGRAPAGYIHSLAPENLPSGASRSPHAFGVEHICEAGRMRGLAVPERVRMFAIEVEDPFTLGADMTPAVEQAIDEATDEVVECALEFAQLAPPAAHAGI